MAVPRSAGPVGLDVVLDGRPYEADPFPHRARGALCVRHTQGRQIRTRLWHNSGLHGYLQLLSAKTSRGAGGVRWRSGTGAAQAGQADLPAVLPSTRRADE